MFDNQLYGLTTKKEALKMFIKEKLCYQKSIANITIQSKQQSNKEIIELIQEQNKPLIEENK